MIKKKETLNFLTKTLLIYIFLYGSYMALSVGIPYKKADLPTRNLFPHILVSIFLALTYPLCCWITFHKNTNFIDNHFDISFAAYTFVTTITLQLVLYYFTTSKVKAKSVSAFMSLIHVSLLSMPIIQILYFIKYQTPITEAGCMAFLQTNKKEAIEFIMQNIGLFGVFSLLVSLMLLLIGFYFANKLPLNDIISTFSKKFIASCCIICLGASVYSYKIFPDIGVMSKYLNAKNYFVLSSLFYKYHENNFQKLLITLPEKKIG